MPVERYVVNPGTLREDSRVRVTGPFGAIENAAIEQMFRRAANPGLADYGVWVRAVLADAGWPIARGEYWIEPNGRRWAPSAGAAHPDWASPYPADHPCTQFAHGSIERDLHELLWLTEIIPLQRAAGASPEEMDDLVLSLGSKAGKFDLAGRFDKLVKAGAGTKKGGHKGGSAKRDRNPELVAVKDAVIADATYRLADGWKLSKSQLAKHLVKDHHLSVSDSTVRDWMKTPSISGG